MKRANRPVPTLIEEIAMTQEDRIEALTELVREILEYLGDKDDDPELWRLVLRARALVDD